MAQVLIRNLDDETVARLKRKAERAGLSLEAFLRQLLTSDAPSRSDAVAKIESLRKTVRAPEPGEPLAADIVREMRRRPAPGDLPRKSSSMQALRYVGS